MVEIAMPSENPAATRPKSNWAQIFSAVIAAVALVDISILFSNSNENAKRTAARQAFMSHSEAALKYPEYDEPDLAAIKKDKLKYVQYQEYVAHMLFAYDEIFTVEDVPAWRKTFEHDLDHHKAYLCAEISGHFFESVFEKMQNRLKEFKAKNCPH